MDRKWSKRVGVMLLVISFVLGGICIHLGMAIAILFPEYKIPGLCIAFIGGFLFLQSLNKLSP